MSCTIERSSPTRRLNSVDLPTFGRPTMAIEKIPSSSGSSGSGAAGGSASTSASSRSPLPRPWMADTGCGSPSPRRRERPRRRSRGVRRRPCWPRASTGLSARWRTRATWASSSVMPTLTSTTRRITSASATARSAWRLTCRASGSRAVARGRRQPAAGVDDGERAAVPVGLEHLAVAGDAGLLLDDGVAPPDEAVHQRRLADVGAADDGDDREGGVHERTLHRGDERRAVGGDDLDRTRQVGGRRAVEEAAVREHDVGQEARGRRGRLAAERGARRRGR